MGLCNALLAAEWSELPGYYGNTMVVRMFGGATCQAWNIVGHIATECVDLGTLGLQSVIGTMLSTFALRVSTHFLHLCTSTVLLVMTEVLDTKYQVMLIASL